MKRKGFLLLWAVTALAAGGILISGMAFTLHTALDLEGKGEAELDEALIAQDVMERAKYFLRFGKGAMPSSGPVTRNGKVYDVNIRRQKELLQEVPMVRVRCQVKGQGSDGFALETLVEDRT